MMGKQMFENERPNYFVFMQVQNHGGGKIFLAPHQKSWGATALSAPPALTPLSTGNIITVSQY